MSAAQKVNAANFESEVLQSPVPVLVDLYADWCGPCRMMGPVLDQVANKVQGQAKVVKVNVDEEPELAASFGVSSIPMLVVLHNGKVVSHVVGAVSEAQALEMLQKASPVAQKAKP